MSIYDYDPDQKPKMSKEQRDEMMKKFLEKGGKVQKLKPGYPINVGSLDKKPQQVDKWLKLFSKSFGNTSLDRIYIPSFDCSWNFASSLNK